MPKDIQKGIKRLSLVPGQEKTARIKKQKKPRPSYLNERWVYGFHLKNKTFRRLSKEYGLPWQSDPLYAKMRLQWHILASSNVFYEWESFSYRGRNATFLVFLEDDGRKRLEKNRCTETQMDSVRKALELPEDTKPKWYNYYGSYDTDAAELSSEDEDAPPLKNSNLPVGMSKKLSENVLPDGAEKTDTDDEDIESYDEVGMFYKALEEYCYGEDEESSEDTDEDAKDAA